MQGEPLSMRDVAAYAGTTGFQSKLQPGERAVTLAVDSNTGVAGFIVPDSHVDVMMQVGSAADTKTRPILSDVRVVASGTTYKRQPGETTAVPTSNVTVAVTPGEASKLINGMSAGRIYLTLRSDKDHTPIAVSDVNSLFGKPAKPQIAESISLPAPPLPPPSDGRADVSLPAPVAAPAPIPTHEVEQWQGDKRDVTAVHAVE
jgi:pilus assembly protein CpaB